MMASNRALLLNFDLGETADMIRETVRVFAERNRAARRRDRPQQ